MLSSSLFSSSTSLFPRTVSIPFRRSTSTLSIILGARSIRLTTSMSSSPSARSASTAATAPAGAATGQATSGRKPAQDAIEEGDPITVPSLSASLVLVAPLQERTADGYDYRVLLLKRNARSTTFFSAHVFPGRSYLFDTERQNAELMVVGSPSGGNLDPIDRDRAAWSSFFDSQASSPEDDKLRAVKLCAVRETFEECGILLIEGQGKGRERWAAVSDQDKAAWRNKVYKDGKTFVDLFKMLSADDSTPTLPGLSSMQYRANWITPANMKRRFDTHFFFAILPPSSRSSPSDSSSSSAAPVHSEHVASSDGGETVSADWLTPQEAISRTLLHAHAQQTDDASASQGSIILFPPQFYLVAELVKTKSWKDLVHAPSSVSPGPALIAPRHVVPFEPEIKGVEDASGNFRAATVLIGDPEHSKTDQSTCLPTDRHRTYVLLPAKKKDPKWKAKPPLGLTVMGVHRQGMGRLFGEGWDVTMKEGDTGESAHSGTGETDRSSKL